MRPSRLVACRVVVLSLIVVLAVASPARAQTVAPAISPEFRTDILKLLDLTTVTEAAKQSVNVLTIEVMDRIEMAQPSLSEKARARAKELLTSEITTLWEGPDGLLQTELVEVYAQHLSHEDVRALLEFYNSAPGKHLLAALPALQATAAARSAAWMEKHLTIVGDRVKAQLAAEGLK